MISKKIVSCCIFFVALGSSCPGEHGGIEFSGGKPIVIAFPVGCDALLWEQEDFKIKVTVFRDVESGLVTRVWVITEKGRSWADEDAVKELLPKWQIAFLASILNSVKLWRFQKTSSIAVSPSTGDALDKIVGRDMTFRFIRKSNGMCRIQIIDNYGVIADDAPSL